MSRIFITGSEDGPGKMAAQSLVADLISEGTGIQKVSFENITSPGI